MDNERWLLKNGAGVARTIYYSLQGPKLLAINRTRVRIGLGVQCVIILMKYRFETFKQLSGMGKIAHFFTAKQSHPFYCRGIDSGLRPLCTSEMWVHFHWRRAHKSQQRVPHLSRPLYQYNSQWISAQSFIMKETRAKMSPCTQLHMISKYMHRIFI